MGNGGTTPIPRVLAASLSVVVAMAVVVEVGVVVDAVDVVVVVVAMVGRNTSSWVVVSALKDTRA